MTQDSASRLMIVAPKRYFEGTHRAVQPMETLERLRPVLPEIGVTRVGVVTGLDIIGIPVVMVCRPNARSLSVSQGKGVELPAAKVSGLMEAVEAWHAENVLLPLRLATYRELRAVSRVVDVHLLPRRGSSRFHPDLTILWIEGTDVFSADRVWVPYECVHLDMRVSRPHGSGCFLNTSTGLASGNHLLEAVSHALCEVVERDAVVLSRERTTADQASRRLDLATITDPGCRQLLDKYTAAGVAVQASDLTTDIALPVFSVTVADRSPGLARRLPAATGYGCHPDRAVALSRALTEAAQGRLTLIAGSRDDMPPVHYREMRQSSAAAAHGAEPEVGMRSYAQAPDAPGESIDADVVTELDGLKMAGIRQAILVDLTRPDVGIPVVRMVVPGMEGWTHRTEPSLPGPRRRAVQAGS